MQSTQQRASTAQSTTNRSKLSNNNQPSYGSESSEDSDATPQRWQVQADVEMDCVFLDEDQEEDELLPELFDTESVQMIKSENCQLCAVKFTFLCREHNCKKCGKAVCDTCSHNKRRLSKIDKEKFRVCDECDILLSNYNFSRMYMREISDKKSNLQQLQNRIEQVRDEVSERTEQLERLKLKYQQKLKEVNEKQMIKDRQLGDRKAQVDQLREVNEKMREKLAALDEKLAQQSSEIAKLKMEKDKIELTS